MIDAVIILVTLGAVYRSWGSGFLRQFCGNIGFFGGLLLGRIIEPRALHLFHSNEARATATVAIILGLALAGLGIGEYLGLRLKHRVLKSGRHKLDRLDNGLGSLLTAGTVLFSLWLLGSVAGSVPSSQLQSPIRNSHILQTMNRVLPSANTIIASLSQLIDPNGFPDVFIGTEPIPKGNVNLPALGDLATAVNADKDSVLRIEGEGCGGIVSGSGFVVADGVVATNAHVVAGIHKVFAQDTNGNHKASVVWFDSDLDFALLRVPKLAGKPLVFNTAKVEPGTPAAVIGFPGGGNFSAKPAAILDQLSASGHNIYGRGQTLRDVYEMRADVIPGNSGGPLIGKDGRVIGVVFAESTTYKGIGYSLTATKVVSQIKQVGNNRTTVDTGRCAE